MDDENYKRKPRNVGPNKVQNLKLITIMQLL